MKIFIGSSNQGKIKEIQKIFCDQEIVAGSEVSEFFNRLDIEENGATFEENALIKARSFYEALEKNIGKNLSDLPDGTQKGKIGVMGDDCVVMSDDSGLCVEALGGAPGIYSARYANLAKGISGSASDSENIKHLIANLCEKGVCVSRAHFVATIALVGNIGGRRVEKVFRGELEGKVIDKPRGQNGFGYDPLFVPTGYECTLGEIEACEKNKISHRKKALQQARDFLERIKQA
ncbi:hypothetical protein BJI48_02985 [Helicobacter sp. 11S02596-1]|nr:hypothetical protein BJI48_02985 [Helicobacter sp. 11S02596-1]